MLKKPLVTLTCLLLIINLTYSQTKPDAPSVSETRQGKFTVSGIVTDSETNEPLIGASVYIKSSRYGGFTGNDGRYKLAIQEGNYILVASYIGYKTEEKSIQVNADTQISFTLHVLENQIEEVKITKQRNFWGNMDLGRSISTLDSKRLDKLNTGNATDALKASIPGVWSSSTSGAPGDHQKVVIRGLNTLFGCSDPLYIIDGVAVPIVNMRTLGIADLNIHDIESMTVLKDASSTALYGYQGGNGVVIIDTKKYSGESHISFSTKFGVQQVTNRLDLMKTKDFLSALDSAKLYKISKIRKYYPDYSPDMSSKDW